jgi:hypothetical protein
MGKRGREDLVVVFRDMPLFNLAVGSNAEVEHPSPQNNKLLLLSVQNR